MRNFYAFVVGILLIGGSSCNIINPSEVVPTYVHLDSFSFVGNSAYGSSSHKITNVYVYFNGASVGVFDLPVTFPVIANTQGTLTVVPGIDFEGLTGYEVIYPFYTADTMHLTPSPGTTFNFAPKTGYHSLTTLSYLEAFETGIHDFQKVTGDTDMLIVPSSSGQVFEGSGSGLISITAGKDSASVVTKTGFPIVPGKESYLEFDYKSTIPMAVGMATVVNSTGSSYSEYLIALKARPTWGKIYIGLRDFVGNHQGSEYHVLFRTQKPSTLTDGYLLIDNVKVVSFK